MEGVRIRMTSIDVAMTRPCRQHSTSTNRGQVYVLPCSVISELFATNVLWLWAVGPALMVAIATHAQVSRAHSKLTRKNQKCGEHDSSLRRHSVSSNFVVGQLLQAKCSCLYVCMYRPCCIDECRPRCLITLFVKCCIESVQPRGYVLFWRV